MNPMLPQQGMMPQQGLTPQQRPMTPPQGQSMGLSMGQPQQAPQTQEQAISSVGDILNNVLQQAEPKAPQGLGGQPPQPMLPQGAPQGMGGPPQGMGGPQQGLGGPPPMQEPSISAPGHPQGGVNMQDVQRSADGAKPSQAVSNGLGGPPPQGGVSPEQENMVKNMLGL